MTSKVPVTILTGFLGSGKTTLLNHILQAEHGKKIAVIENEFGEVGIDDALLKPNLQTQSDEDVVEMMNGCICCTVRQDLVEVLKKLAKRAERGLKLDAIVIETTGLADPAPIIATLKSNQWIDDNFLIDAVVCLASAKHVKAHLDEEKPDGAVNEAVQQVAFSDKILLNKVDLVTPEELADIRSRIATINNFAEVIECERSRVDLSKIIGISSFDIERCVDMDPVLFNQEQGEAKGLVASPRRLPGLRRRPPLPGRPGSPCESRRTPERGPA